jgi:hypothetical protein
VNVGILCRRGGGALAKAGIVQLVVLVGLPAAEAATVLVAVELVVRGRFGPA